MLILGALVVEIWQGGALAIDLASASATFAPAVKLVLLTVLHAHHNDFYGNHDTRSLGGHLGPISSLWPFRPP